MPLMIQNVHCQCIVHQHCTTQLTLVNLHPNECTQGLRYYPFTVNLDRCVGSCNTLNYLSHRVCVPNKTEGLNLSVFNMITGKDESLSLTKYIPRKCEGKLDGGKCNSNQKRNNNKCLCKCTNSKQHHVCEINYIWNLASCSFKNGTY